MTVAQLQQRLVTTNPPYESSVAMSSAAVLGSTTSAACSALSADCSASLSTKMIWLPMHAPISSAIATDPARAAQSTQEASPESQQAVSARDRRITDEIRVSVDLELGLESNL